MGPPTHKRVPPAEVWSHHDGRRVKPRERGSSVYAAALWVTRQPPWRTGWLWPEAGLPARN